MADCCPLNQEEVPMVLYTGTGTARRFLDVTRILPRDWGPRPRIVPARLNARTIPLDRVLPELLHHTLGDPSPDRAVTLGWPP